MSAIAYLTNYSVITPRRLKLYHQAFDHQITRRKNKPAYDAILRMKGRSSSAWSKPMSEDIANTAASVPPTILQAASGGANSLLGTVQTREGMNADVHHLVTNEIHSELVNAYGGGNGGGATEQSGTPTTMDRVGTPLSGAFGGSARTSSVMRKRANMLDDDHVSISVSCLITACDFELSFEVVERGGGVVVNSV